jgi:AraC-like DNA-binding protein
MEDLIEIIDEHIQDTDFDMNVLQLKVGMSQSSLYRKLKSLTDQSGNEFIRNIRLARAAEMLIQTELSISEVAYRVGFSDPKYFSTCFRKCYGISPSHYKLKALNPLI